MITASKAKELSLNSNRLHKAEEFITESLEKEVIKASSLGLYFASKDFLNFNEYSVAFTLKVKEKLESYGYKVNITTYHAITTIGLSW